MLKIRIKCPSSWNANASTHLIETSFLGAEAILCVLYMCTCWSGLFGTLKRCVPDLKFVHCSDKI